MNYLEITNLTKDFAKSRANSIYNEYERSNEKTLAKQYLGETLANRMVKLKLSKEQIIDRIYQDLLGFGDMNTPWDLQAQDPSIYGFNEDGTLRIVVNNRERTDLYTFDVTEELMLGILIVLEGTNRFAIHFKDSYLYFGEHSLPITLGAIKHKYILSPDVQEKRYVATTIYGLITFGTIDVIQGVKTGASWLSVDPHNYIKDIKDNGTLVTF